MPRRFVLCSVLFVLVLLPGSATAGEDSLRVGFDPDTQAEAWEVVYDTTTSLPKPARDVLDSLFVNWKLGGVFAWHWDWTRWRAEEDSSQSSSPVVAWGDFDEDGHRDYAVKVDSWSETGDTTQSVVGILSRKQVWEASTLETLSFEPLNNWLMVIQKGEEGFDHSKDEPFFYERDALFIGYDEKTGALTFTSKEPGSVVRDLTKRDVGNRTDAA